MKFLKEYIIIIVILIFVLSINYIFEKKLNDALFWMSDGMTSVENKLTENKENDAENEFYDLKNQWGDKAEKLALFVEHKELEDIESKISIIESNFNRNELDELYENIADLKFMLDRVGEKNQLKLKNIL